VPEYLDSDRQLETFWRAVVLFGRNVASYKFALAKSLIELSDGGKECVSLEELAEPFSRHIVQHLAIAPKQATSSSSRFLNACSAFGKGDIGKDELIGRTVTLGFNNVIDAFHIVNRGEIPVRFFTDERNSGGGVRITDNLHHLRERFQFQNLPNEVEARWRLVETAWEVGVGRHLLDFDGESFTLADRGRRVNVTSCREALNGYQKGKCFYCFADISVVAGSEHLADVDHFIPWTLRQTDWPLNIDGVWNLVLSCRHCNRGPNGKSSRLPHRRLLERLSNRNEFFIGSHHPLREALIAQTGLDEQSRIAFLNGAYDTAQQWLIHTWNPEQRNAAAF
jgi:hypothetical protein